jgi:hypothetical protein
MDNMKTMAKESVSKSLRENKSLLSIADDLTTENLRYGGLIADIRDVLWTIKQPEIIDGGIPEEHKVDRNTWLQVAAEQTVKLKTHNDDLYNLLQHLREIRG